MAAACSFSFRSGISIQSDYINQLTRHSCCGLGQAWASPTLARVSIRLAIFSHTYVQWYHRDWTLTRHPYILLYILRHTHVQWYKGTRALTRCLYIFPYLVLCTFNGFTEPRHSLDASIIGHMLVPYVFVLLFEKIQDIPEGANERESDRVCLQIIFCISWFSLVSCKPTS